jgi:hypothetical protein
MNGWKLYIQDSLDHEKVVQNPDCIPHKGDCIYMGYTPCPEVLQVVINYDEKTIVVQCS